MFFATGCGRDSGIVPTATHEFEKIVVLASPSGFSVEPEKINTILQVYASKAAEDKIAFSGQEMYDLIRRFWHAIIFKDSEFDCSVDKKCYGSYSGSTITLSKIDWCHTLAHEFMHVYLRSLGAGRGGDPDHIQKPYWNWVNKVRHDLCEEVLSESEG